MTTAETWGLVANVVSFVLGVFAMGLSIIFYLAGRGTERRVGDSLTKIETQVEMLQKITGKQLDRLTRFATERPEPEHSKPAELVLSLIQIAEPLVRILHPTPAQGQAQTQNTDEFTAEAVTCYIGLYYYTALTNYWAQGFLPRIDGFDEANTMHTLAKRVVDSSNADFNGMAKLLEGTHQSWIDASPLKHLLEEARDVWRTTVRNSSECWLAQEKGQPSV